MWKVVFRFFDHTYPIWDPGIWVVALVLGAVTYFVFFA